MADIDGRFCQDAKTHQYYPERRNLSIVHPDSNIARQKAVTMPADLGICPSTFWWPLHASQFFWQLLRIDRIDE
jgi:hypothetical protein